MSDQQERFAIAPGTYVWKEGSCFGQRVADAGPFATYGGGSGAIVPVLYENGEHGLVDVREELRHNGRQRMLRRKLEFFESERGLADGIRLSTTLPQITDTGGGIFHVTFTENGRERKMQMHLIQNRASAMVLPT